MHSQIGLRQFKIEKKHSDASVPPPWQYDDIPLMPGYPLTTVKLTASLGRHTQSPSATLPARKMGTERPSNGFCLQGQYVKPSNIFISQGTCICLAQNHHPTQLLVLGQKWLVIFIFERRTRSSSQRATG
jgi:hypothetical protein